MVRAVGAGVGAGVVFRGAGVQGYNDRQRVFLCLFCEGLLLYLWRVVPFRGDGGVWCGVCRLGCCGGVVVAVVGRDWQGIPPSSSV